jgi:hypothetical protein
MLLVFVAYEMGEPITFQTIILVLITDLQAQPPTFLASINSY